MTKKHSRARRHTSLAKHRKRGTKLETALSDLPVEILEWDRDLLPEFLWLASLAEAFGIDQFHMPYNAFMDALDGVCGGDRILLGLMTDFGQVPEAARIDFLEHHQDLVEELFHVPFGRIQALYPEGPASWLARPELIRRGGRLEPETELNRLRMLVRRLLPGKDEFTARVRVLPFTRLMKHGKVAFPPDLEIVDAMPRYPHACTDEESSLIEAMARIHVNMEFQLRDDLSEYEWSKYFWRHNHDMAVCCPKRVPIRASEGVSVDTGNCIKEVLLYNGKAAREYLAELQQKMNLDVYDPTRDEVLAGLFSRVTRLFTLMTENPLLWARDTAGIMLRCLTETAITFVYLAQQGTSEEFQAFVAYGEGQQKLLMLHLQDSYPKDRSLEGSDTETISDLSGGFSAELTDIELGHWCKKNTRRLAGDAGMERLYRLVFSPTSDDLHGGWLSLKNSNLVRCSEVLHRFHRLPAYVEPPLYVYTAEAAREVYEHCVEVGVANLGYPRPAGVLRGLRPLVRQEGDSEG